MTLPIGGGHIRFRISQVRSFEEVRLSATAIRQSASGVLVGQKCGTQCRIGIAMSWMIPVHFAPQNGALIITFRRSFSQAGEGRLTFKRIYFCVYKTNEQHGAVFLQQLIVAQLVNKFPPPIFPFFGTRSSVTIFARAHQLVLPLARHLQTTIFHPV